MALVEFEKVDQTGIVTLNRPERMNALGRDMLAELRAAFDEVDRDPDLKVGIITGNGRGFCAGRDIKEGAEDGAGLRDQATTHNVDLFMTNNHSKPFVSAVNGFAGGAGFYLATRSVDFVVAGASAAFQIAEVPRGILHGWQSGFWLGVSRAAAREIAFGFKVGGRRAYDMGMANAYAEDGELMDAALAAAKTIASMPSEVIALNREFLKRLDPQLPEELAGDARQAYLSMLEKQGAGDEEFMKQKAGSAS